MTAAVDLTPAVVNVKLYRGDDSVIKVTLNDDTGAPVVLSTTDWSAQLRISKSSPDVVGTCTINATQAATGVLFITFPLLSTGSYYYDVQCATGGLRTWIAGRVTVSTDVTHA